MSDAVVVVAEMDRHCAAPFSELQVDFFGEHLGSFASELKIVRDREIMLLESKSCQ